MPNEYEPWKVEGITEVAYWQRRYYEMSRANASLGQLVDIQLAPDIELRDKLALHFITALVLAQGFTYQERAEEWAGGAYMQAGAMLDAREATGRTE